MTWQDARRYQFWALMIFSVLVVYLAPHHWRLSPDGGMYVGTAESLVAHGTYTFNGLPNLQYYPGISTILAAVFALFGSSATAAHVTFALLFLAVPWLARALFTRERYGWIGIAVPLILASGPTLQRQGFHILSDAPFLALTLAVLLLWLRHAEHGDRRAFWGCVALVAVAPLVRFQGLFLVAAFGLTLLINWITARPLSWPAFARLVGLGVIVAAPFVLWTWRNYVNYTPDAPNLVLNFFFGLQGPSPYAAGFGKVDWIDAAWKYKIYNYLYSLMGLARSLLGGDIHQILPKFLPAMVLPVLLLAGLRRYLGSTSRLELVYVALSLAYIFFDRTRSNSLYQVDRYWIPMLPFIAVWAGFGFAAARDWGRGIRGIKADGVVAGVAVACTVFAVAGGIGGLVDNGGLEARRLDANTAKVHAQTAAAVDRLVPGDAVVLTSDWAIVPRLIRRQSWYVVAGPIYRPTLERIAHYGATFMVLVEGTSDNMFNTGQAMAGAFPDLFTRLEEIDRPAPGPVAEIYRIDLDGVRALLAQRKGRF